MLARETGHTHIRTRTRSLFPTHLSARTLTRGLGRERIHHQDDQDGLFAKKSPAPARGSSLFADADLDEAGMDGKDAEDKDASAPAGGGEGAAVAGEGVGGQGKKKKANKKKR